MKNYRTVDHCIAIPLSCTNCDIAPATYGPKIVQFSYPIHPVFQAAIKVNPIRNSHIPETLYDWLSSSKRIPTITSVYLTQSEPTVTLVHTFIASLLQLNSDREYQQESCAIAKMRAIYVDREPWPLWPFEIFPRWRRPPSWICSNRK